MHLVPQSYTNNEDPAIVFFFFCVLKKDLLKLHLIFDQGMQSRYNRVYMGIWGEYLELVTDLMNVMLTASFGIRIVIILAAHFLFHHERNANDADLIDV